jgi:hypothetical protein
VIEVARQAILAVDVVAGQQQARDFLVQPDIETMEGKQDRAILAVLLGCALRRSELAALDCGHIQQRDGRWVFIDLVGKGKRIRTVPIPPFVKVAIDAWTAAAGLSGGPLFRRVRRRKYPEKTPVALRAADAADGADHARLVRGFHLGAKEPNEGVKRVVLDIRIGAPDAFDQCFPGRHAICVAHQQFENCVFSAREIDLSAAAPHFPRAQM